MTDQSADQQPVRPNHQWNLPIWLDRFLLIIGIGATVLAVIILVMWVVINFVWAAEDIAQLTTVPTQIESNAILEIDYPALIPANDTPVDFLFTLRNDIPLVQTTTITMAIPSGLRVLDMSKAAITGTSSLTTVNGAPIFTSTTLIKSRLISDANASPKVMSIEFGPQTEDRAKSVRFLNARTENTWWLLLPGNWQCVTITAPPSVQLPSPCLWIETTADRAWRNFVNGAVNDKSPLVISAVALLALAGAAASRWWNQQAKKEQQGSENSQRVLNEFRAAMRDQQNAKARQAFGEMQMPKLLPYILPEDLAHARYLINLTEGEISEPLIKSAAAVWPAETAGALAYAINNAPKDRVGLLHAYRTFPLDRLTSEYRQSFEKANAEFGVPSLQARKWPRLPEFRDQQPPFLPGSVAEKIGFNLFASEYAEEEVALLFDKSYAFFWPEHILYNHMMANSSPEIVWGRPGTGKTVLGLALGEYPVKETLGCYLAGLPALSNIQMCFAWKLLTFVRYHPTFLSPLDQYDRHLLAQFLTSSLGQELVLAEIHTVPEGVKKWQKELDDDSGRQLRESNVLTQLRLLEQDVIAVVASSDLTETQWPLVLAHCVQVLGFRQIRLVLDAIGDKCPEWLQQFVLPNLSTWVGAGIAVKIMVSDDVATELQLSEHPSRFDVLSSRHLHWKSDQMRQMIEWRHQHSGTNVALADVIADDVLDEMITMSHLNPRCFARLWNVAAVLDLAAGRITPDVLRQVEKQVSCR
jgi:hypothetical protein